MRNNLFQTLHLKVIKPKIDTDQRKTIKNSEIYTCEKVICIKNIHREKNLHIYTQIKCNKILQGFIIHYNNIYISVPYHSKGLNTEKGMEGERKGREPVKSPCKHARRPNKHTNGIC